MKDRSRVLGVSPESKQSCAYESLIAAESQILAARKVPVIRDLGAVMDIFDFSLNSVPVPKYTIDGVLIQ